MADQPCLHPGAYREWAKRRHGGEPVKELSARSCLALSRSFGPRRYVRSHAVRNVRYLRPAVVQRVARAKLKDWSRRTSVLRRRRGEVADPAVFHVDRLLVAPGGHRRVHDEWEMSFSYLTYIICSQLGYLLRTPISLSGLLSAHKHLTRSSPFRALTSPACPFGGRVAHPVLPRGDGEAVGLAAMSIATANALRSSRLAQFGCCVSASRLEELEDRPAALPTNNSPSRT